MSQQKEIERDLQEIKDQVADMQTAWQEILEEFAKASKDKNKEDLFATIDYLSLCDQLRTMCLINSKEIEPHIQFLTELKKKKAKDKKEDESVTSLLEGIGELRKSMQKKVQNIEEEYPVLADTTLRYAQDLISKFSDLMSNEVVTPTLKTEISQNLEKELFIQELNDSLESYREAREDYISELTMDYLQKLPEDQMPEDLGEEMPEIDSILSQLDTIITTCETAILRQDIGD